MGFTKFQSDIPRRAWVCVPDPVLPLYQEKKTNRPGKAWHRNGEGREHPGVGQVTCGCQGTRIPCLRSLRLGGFWCPSCLRRFWQHWQLHEMQMPHVKKGVKIQKLSGYDKYWGDDATLKRDLRHYGALRGARARSPHTNTCPGRCNSICVARDIEWFRGDCSQPCGCPISIFTARRLTAASNPQLRH